FLPRHTPTATLFPYTTLFRSGIAAVTGWDPHAEPSREISFSPTRVLMQDLTGVPAVVDLAAMRDALAELGGDPARINPHIPAERSEEHTSELQSQSNLVCRLL